MPVEKTAKDVKRGAHVQDSALCGQSLAAWRPEMLVQKWTRQAPGSTEVLITPTVPEQ